MGRNPLLAKEIIRQHYEDNRDRINSLKLDDAHQTLRAETKALLLKQGLEVPKIGTIKSYLREFKSGAKRESSVEKRLRLGYEMKRDEVGALSWSHDVRTQILTLHTHSLRKMFKENLEYVLEHFYEHTLDIVRNKYINCTLLTPPPTEHTLISRIRDSYMEDLKTLAELKQLTEDEVEDEILANIEVDVKFTLGANSFRYGFTKARMRDVVLGCENFLFTMDYLHQYAQTSPNPLLPYMDENLLEHF